MARKKNLKIMSADNMKVNNQSIAEPINCLKGESNIKQTQLNIGASILISEIFENISLLKCEENQQADDYVNSFFLNLKKGVASVYTDFSMELKLAKIGAASALYDLSDRIKSVNLNPYGYYSYKDDDLVKIEFTFYESVPEEEVADINFIFLSLFECGESLAEKKRKRAKKTHQRSTFKLCEDDEDEKKVYQCIYRSKGFIFNICLIDKCLDMAITNMSLENITGNEMLIT
jgi:hypothetical protein